MRIVIFENGTLTKVLVSSIAEQTLMQMPVLDEKGMKTGLALYDLFKFVLNHEIKISNSDRQVLWRELMNTTRNVDFDLKLSNNNLKLDIQKAENDRTFLKLNEGAQVKDQFFIDFYADLKTGWVALAKDYSVLLEPDNSGKILINFDSLTNTKTPWSTLNLNDKKTEILDIESIILGKQQIYSGNYGNIYDDPTTQVFKSGLEKLSILNQRTHQDMIAVMIYEWPIRALDQGSQISEAECKELIDRLEDKSEDLAAKRKDLGKLKKAKELFESWKKDYPNQHQMIDFGKYIQEKGQAEISNVKSLLNENGATDNLRSFDFCSMALEVLMLVLEQPELFEHSAQKLSVEITSKSKLYSELIENANADKFLIPYFQMFELLRSKMLSPPDNNQTDKRFKADDPFIVKLRIVYQSFYWQYNLLQRLLSKSDLIIENKEFLSSLKSFWQGIQEKYRNNPKAVLFLSTASMILIPYTHVPSFLTASVKVLDTYVLSDYVTNLGKAILTKTDRYLNEVGVSEKEGPRSILEDLLIPLYKDWSIYMQFLVKWGLSQYVMNEPVQSVESKLLEINGYLDEKIKHAKLLENVGQDTK